MIDVFEKLFRHAREGQLELVSRCVDRTEFDAQTDRMWEGAVDAASREVVGMPAAEVAKSSRDTDPCPCFVKREGDTDA